LKAVQGSDPDFESHDRELAKSLNFFRKHCSLTFTWIEPPGLTVQNILLQMIYYTALSTLHRPRALGGTRLGPFSSTGASANAESRAIIRTAATAISSFATELDNRDLVKYLPLTGITVLLPALATHLLDLKCPEVTIRDKATQGFSQCIRVLNQLRSTYIAADCSAIFVEHAVRATSARIASPTESVDSALVDDCLDVFEAGHLLDDLASMTDWQRDPDQQTNGSRLQGPPMDDMWCDDDMTDFINLLLNNDEPLVA